MMLPDEMIRLYIERSDEALKSAQINIKHDLLNSAKNRMYYSMFYLIECLAFLKNFNTSKHTELIGWFNKKFIHEDKIFDQTIYKILKNIYEERTLSDYTISYQSNKEEIIKNFEAVQHFNRILKHYIENNSKNDAF